MDGSTLVDPRDYMELGRCGGELLFQVLTDREQRASVAIACNESFAGWIETFTGPCLSAAVGDRLPSAATSSKPAPTPTDSRTQKVNAVILG